MSATPLPRSARRHSGPPHRARQRGFTLIEVMVASVILSVFVLGLSGLWQASSRRVEDLTVKQKAVFVLNAEMERLAAMYGHTEFGEDGPETAWWFDNAILPATRLVYPEDVDSWANDDFVTSNFNTFRTGTEFRVYTTSGGAQRNYVWIDRGRNLAGRISWTEEEVDVGLLGCTLAGGCWCRDWDGGGADECRQIELYLEYPYRPTSAGAFATPANLKTMSLSTIVGRLR